ncbi:hypothetical protein [Mesonia sp.]|uniref:hypothetical protein n=1 Tax=Mesonia sp. TaxID=1960830 RepID=UPI00175EA5DC|nr:hypothetical protein [Mesonia sp.]HIB36566.1 hypothetical protein [Mesonia sp.]HIO27240.1 hypothetical protein [Flavobacteriaceae bacterium]
MKKIKVILLFAFVAILCVSCSKDDDGSKSNTPEGVPTGEVVAVSQRSLVLTGFDDANMGKSLNNTQKWWLYDYGEIISDCDEYSQDLDEDIYIGFLPDGELKYLDMDGNHLYSRTWAWGPGQNSVTLDGNTMVQYEFTALNEDEIIYYSSTDLFDCNITTYEKLHEPYYE